MTTTLQGIPLKTIQGNASSLGEFGGKVLLVVNVASKCGLTPQYDALEALYKKYREQGLVVLGFPANDFGAQEPGTNDEIAAFCSTKFSVDFPLFEKIAVTGKDTHPLYKALTEAKPETTGETESFREKLRGHGLTPTSAPEVLWNFEKFVVNRAGDVVARFAPATTPDDPALVALLERELNAKA